MNIINIRSSSVLGLIKLDSFVVDCDSSVWSILSDNSNFGYSCWSNSLNRLWFFKCNRSWLIIIYNCYNSFSISTFKFYCLFNWNWFWIWWLIKLYPEILIRLPVVIIINLNSNKFQSVLLLSGELEKFINSLIIITSSCFLIDGVNSNTSSLIKFIFHIDFDLTTGFGNRVMETSETKLWVRVLGTTC